MTTKLTHEEENPMEETTKPADELSYEGIDEAELVLALYRGTRALGMGVYADRPGLKLEEVRDALNGRESDGRLHFDYFSGRPLKVSLDTKSKTFRAGLYDRDAGRGAAAAIVTRLRAKTSTAATPRAANGG